jgi:osmotically-inducible protein OsmY
MAAIGDIRASVDEALKGDHALDSDDIEVDLFGDDIVLNGTVPSQAQSAEATAAAQQVAGVKAVRNLLAVALPDDEYGDDDALAQEVNQALAATLVAPAGVQATAREGNLRLTGTVPTSAEKTAAEECAAGCAGVLGITNDIAVLDDSPEL